MLEATIEEFLQELLHLIARAFKHLIRDKILRYTFVVFQLFDDEIYFLDRKFTISLLGEV